MRRKVIAGNWKMNKTHQEAVEFINELVVEHKNNGGCGEGDKILVAPFTALPALIEATKDKCIKVAAQNMHFEENGAFTGEISPSMLTALGVEVVVLGHSERREMFNETDETVNKKTIAAHKHNLTPIVCVGEHLEQRENGTTNDVVKVQVEKALNGLTNEQVIDTIIAYEPIWAIGTGKTATADQADETCGYIRTVIADNYGQDVANQVIIQYGGSVKPDNIEELMSKENIDGALVGGASLAASDFAQLTK